MFFLHCQLFFFIQIIHDFLFLDKLMSRGTLIFVLKLLFLSN